MNCARRNFTAILRRLGITLLIPVCCWAAIALSAATLFAGESTEESSEAVRPPLFAESLIIPGNVNWADTGVDVRNGEAISISAQGNVRVVPAGRRGLIAQPEVVVGPKGTFFFPDELADANFPLPAAARGPAPCYCLIGQIGDGPPFFVGERKSWQVNRDGRLYLGINDFDVSDNVGEFVVRVSRTTKVQPMTFEESVSRDATPGSPAPGCSVVVFYLDGLRPDVVREMAAMGHIPNIDNLFLKGGAWCSNAFTAFPSDTITSNGTMWTGCFSDRHGLKGQVRFSRRTLVSESYLEPLGPNRSARLLAPQGVDKFIRDAGEESVRIIRGDEESIRWKQSQTSGVPPLYQHLRNHGGDWATGALPMMTEVPPLLWTRSLVRHMPYFRSQEAWNYIDDANADYARYHLLQRHTPVTIIWMPETDSVSHKLSRGQFGMTRRTIARADELLGGVVAELDAKHELNRTYFLLVSDHGHHGGRTTHLAHFDIANELFHKTRELSSDGEWVGGGLGMSVRQHRFWNRHPEDGSRDFVFIDGDSDGAARIYLPRGHFHSADWLGEPHPGDMLGYRIAKSMPPVDLVASILNTRAVHSDGSVQHPIDLVLLKIANDAVLISTVDRGSAVIHRKRDDKGHWLYKYTVVKNVQRSPDGGVAYEEVEVPETDPLLITRDVTPRLIEYYHNEREWLRITAGTQYPDAVVTLTRHMLWQENLAEREREDAPDLVVTARSGWYFGQKDSPGTMHGYPFPDAMHASFFISGPNVRRGARIDDPCRLADLTPTLLQMVGIEVDPEDFDGRPLQTIYESPEEISTVSAQPVYWQDVDLQAWPALHYHPLAEYEHLPYTINQPASPFDMNNIAYNLLSLTDVNIFSLFDDVISPLSGGRDGKFAVTRAVERVDERARHSSRHRIAEAAEAVDATQITVGDYSLSSLGNMKRIDGTVDWVQRRTAEAGRRVAKPIGRESLPGARFTHAAVDGVQVGFWEIYRFAQRVVVEVLDETLLNGLENNTDKAINRFRQQPAEVVVPPESRTQSSGSALR